MEAYSVLQSIQDFFKNQPFAVFGVSRNKRKFGTTIFFELQKKGISVYPVNPHTDEIDGKTCYRSVENLPNDVKGAIIVTQPPETFDIVKNLITKGIKQIWVQPGAENSEAIKYAKDNGANIIVNQCIFMFSEPVTSIHGFHRWIKKLFRQYPK